MSTTTTSLGGRLPLAERPALTGTQRKLFDRFIAETVPWAQRSGFVMQSADGALIGPFNPLLQSPEASCASTHAPAPTRTGRRPSGSSNTAPAGVPSSARSARTLAPPATRSTGPT